ncbi:cytochrome P450 [Calocera cornea HHB12733]|uniref:Cytochrome P450 n=1 Tax=Calocera cornea HHB12733 TaxID=1353952 RepID=A0A165DLG6_9BASI|nr:cytochrome P450 [Calocera cornea HHB12733]
MAPFPTHQASPALALLVVFVALVFYVTASLLRGLFLSPLSRFPGPKLAAVTRFWAFFEAISGRKVKGVHELHKMYGPIVRVGPNDLSISAPEAIPRLYSYKPFLKDPTFYDALNGGKVEGHLVCQTNPETHARRRKLISTLLSRSAVKGYENDIIHPKIIKALMPFRDGDFYTGTMDVLPALRAITADAAAELTFGKTFGCLDAPNFDHPVLEALAIVSDSVPVINWIPWLNSIPRSLVQYQKIMAPVIQLEKFVSDAWTIEKAGPEPTDVGRTVLSRLAYLLRNDEAKYRDNVALSEALTMIVAGSETTTMAMVSALHELSLNPGIQARIRAEVAELMPEASRVDDVMESGLPSFQVLQQQPYLSAVIKEVLRMYPSVPGLLPRVVPKDGMTVRNQFIPPGTAVAMQAWTIHRDPEVFPEPDTFNPSRWLDASEIELKAMNARFMPFSAGTRSCVGEEFAMAQMYLMIAMFCRFYQFAPAPGCDNGIEDNGFTLSCRHLKMMLSIGAAPPV